MASACGCPSYSTAPPLASTCGNSSFVLFMGLLEMFLKTQCDIEDPCRVPRSRQHLDHEYDFIVVGGGTAGSVVASRLSEVPDWKVLLIEAGGNEPTGAQVPSMFLNFIGTDLDWNYHTEPEPNACLNQPEQRCVWPRGKVLGGTSVLHGMMYIRGSQHDFNQWAAAGNPGWSYEEVLPYFMKSEDNQQLDTMDKGFHMSGGLLPVTQFPYHPPMSYALLQAGQEMGYEVRDLNGLQRTGFALAQTTSKNGIRMSAARAFLRPTTHRPNLHIRLNTLVARVLIDPRSKETYGVELINADGSRQSVVAKKEVILSGGAINSPQILLLSGVGPRQHLEEMKIPVVTDLPGVGYNLHNHVAFFLNFTLDDADTAPLNWATAMEYMLHRSGVMAGTGITELAVLLPSSPRHNTTADHPDLQFFFRGFHANCAQTGQVGERMSDSNREIKINPVLLHPRSRGYLKLKSGNPLDHPLIYANYLTHEDDVRRLVKGIKLALTLTEMPALKKFGIRLDTTPVRGCERLAFGSDEYWSCAVSHETGPENHQAGSCKMGPRSDPEAVVDPLLQVYGVKHLRVADASVMPLVTSGGTNAPVIMIGEKVSDMIKATWSEDSYQNLNSDDFYNSEGAVLGRTVADVFELPLLDLDSDVSNSNDCI